MTQAARVRRMLAWYPRSWRDRYGDEFAELLMDELAEQPRSARRGLNIAASGLRCRLAGLGLAGHPLDPDAARQAGLATVACCAAAFMVAAACLWSQLAIAMQWAVARDAGISESMDVMSAALLACALLALLALGPVARAALASVAAGRGRRLLWPAALFIGGATVLVVGGLHFQNAWPGTGGHLLAQQGLVPGGIAAFCWATTMWITSYWLHPAMLATFTVSQIGWMLACPAAAAAAITGLAALLRRVELSRAAFRYEIWLGQIAAGTMTVFLAGALCWLSAAGAAVTPIFRGGSVDAAGLAVLAAAVVAASCATRRAGLAAD